MTVTEILFIVQYTTGIKYSEMKLSKHTDRLWAKYLVITLMNEEGASICEIATLFNTHRTSVYNSLATISALLQYDKEFKALYLGCIKRMAEMEDAA